LIAIAGVFLTVALTAGSITSWYLGRRSPEQRRLRKLAQAAGTGIVIERQVLTEGLDPTLGRLTRLIPKSPKDMSRLQRRLARAGYPRFESAVYYSLAEVSVPLFLGGLTLLVLGPSAWLYALLAAAAGLALPNYYVRRQTKLRQKAIRNGLPDALDLLTICVEAGCGLEQAIAKATEELHVAHPALAEEMRLITTETRAGKPRLEALRNFAQRTDIEDVRMLVSILTQTGRFGTSVSEALRTHAETARTQRRQRAEERAAKVGVKLVFPLALCLFPALYVVCFGSIVLAIYHAFFSGG
jgi:tight adherence protein C